MQKALSRKNRAVNGAHSNSRGATQPAAAERSRADDTQLVRYTSDDARARVASASCCCGGGVVGVVAALPRFVDAQRLEPGRFEAREARRRKRFYQKIQV